MMTFYMTPGSCSTGIHILLEELELVFAANVLNLPRGDNLTPEFLSLNPKGSIPVLVLDDGTVINDYIEIACWLAETYPKKRLLPSDPKLKARAMNLTSTIVDHIHGQGFTRIFTKDRYSVDPAEQATVEAEGRAIVSDGFEEIAATLQPDDSYLCGDFSIADATLFYTSFWASRIALAVPVEIKQHFDLMCKRPVVKQVLAEEGYRI